MTSQGANLYVIKKPPPVAGITLIRYNGCNLSLSAPLRERYKINEKTDYFNKSFAICTALVAAPLRKLSATIHKFRVLGRVKSRRIRPTKTASFPSANLGMGYSKASKLS